MKRLFRKGAFALMGAGFAALWVFKGPLAAIGAGLAILAMLFVAAMKAAAGEILRFEREQRPDLYA